MCIGLSNGLFLPVFLFTYLLCITLVSVFIQGHNVRGGGMPQKAIKSFKPFSVEYYLLTLNNSEAQSFLYAESQEMKLLNSKHPVG